MVRIGLKELKTYFHLNIFCWIEGTHQPVYTSELNQPHIHRGRLGDRPHYAWTCSSFPIAPQEAAQSPFLQPFYLKNKYEENYKKQNSSFSYYQQSTFVHKETIFIKYVAVFCTLIYITPFI